MEPKYFQQIAGRLNLSIKQIKNVQSLSADGATIPFMARYRKEVTGNLDEVAIGNVIEQIKYFDELDSRKETVLKTIEGLGKLTPVLKNRIEHTFDAIELEDIYLPYKPKRKTKATQAIEKGLEPLAKIIFAQGDERPIDQSEKFISEHVKDSKEALQGARDIIAEWVAENEQARSAVRHLFSAQAHLHAKVINSKKEEAEAQKYRDYFEFDEPLSRSPSHRILAI